MNVLIVCDAQNDNIKGKMAYQDAERICSKLEKKLKGFKGLSVFTMRTFPEYAFEDEEGNIAKDHYCMEGSEGWEIDDRFMDRAYGTVGGDEESCCDGDCQGGCSGEGCEGESCGKEESYILPVEHADHGCFALANQLRPFDVSEKIDSIELCGFGLEDVILSNAVILHTAFPYANIVVDKDYCAARKISSGHTALKALRSCGIAVIED